MSKKLTKEEQKLIEKVKKKCFKHFEKMYKEENLENKLVVFINISKDQVNYVPLWLEEFARTKPKFPNVIFNVND